MESDCFQNKLHTLGYARFYSLQTNYSKISQMPSYPAVAAAVAPAIDWRVRRLKRQHVAVTERERKSRPMQIVCLHICHRVVVWMVVG